MPSEFDLQQMLGDVLRHNRDDSDGMTPIQIIARLRRVRDEMRAGEAQEPFKFGDILIHRWSDMADAKNASAPVMFARYLPSPLAVADHPEAFDGLSGFGSSIAGKVFDCVMCEHSVGSVSFHLADSREYRLATGDDFACLNIEEDA